MYVYSSNLYMAVMARMFNVFFLCDKLYLYYFAELVVPSNSFENAFIT